jgi:mannonate dehydratase
LNRAGTAVEASIRREDWQTRLVNGSDYPLPGVFPLLSLKQMLRKNYIREDEADVLSTIRCHNPLMFDFVLKRSLRIGKNRFGPASFHTRDIFDWPA